MCVYCIVPNTRPWALGIEFTGQKMGIGAYTEKPFIWITCKHANHRLIKTWRVGAYVHGDGHLLETLRTYSTHIHVLTLQNPKQKSRNLN